MISEIEYKITKAIFSVKTDIEIKQMEYHKQNLNIKDNLEYQTSNQNPLFNKPNKNYQTTPNNTKNKIRV